MQRLIIHVDLDSFYASLEELRNTEIRGKPVVICVFSGRSAESGAVSTANYKARELGIRAGMPISLAKRLARNKDVVFLPYDIEHYRTVSERIMDLLEDEADALQQVSIDEAYLDVTKRSIGIWENAEKIAENIKNKIRQREGLTCSIGVGSNKLIAKMASKQKKPEGLTVVRNTEVKKFLENLPVSELHGIGDKTTKTLNQLGIRTVNELASFDLHILEEKFGKNKAKLLQNKAQGIDDSPVKHEEIQQISRIGTLKEDTDNLEIVFEKIKELSIDVEKKLRKKKALFRTISIITVDTTLKTQTKSRTTHQTDDLDSALDIARSLLEEFLEENLGKKLRRVGVRVSNLIFKEDQQPLRDLEKYFGKTTKNSS